MDEQKEPGERRPHERDGGTHRRLERPPGERYAPPPEQAPRKPSLVRGVVVASLVAVVGAVAMTLLAGQLAISSGLLVIAVVIGRFIGLGLRAGARSTINPGRARTLALILAVGGIALAQVGIWIYARSEGGVLGLGDYLGQVFGVLVPLEFALAGIVAVLSAD